MNELEKIFMAEKAKKQIDKDTYEELNAQAGKKMREIKQNAKEQLSFLSNYGCNVYIDKYGQLYVDYSVRNGSARSHKTAQIKVPTSYNGKYMTCEYDGKFYVNWNSNVCHNNKDSYLTLEGIVRTLADRINN